MVMLAKLSIMSKQKNFLSDKTASWTGNGFRHCCRVNDYIVVFLACQFDFWAEIEQYFRQRIDFFTDHFEIEHFIMLSVVVFYTDVFKFLDDHITAGDTGVGSKYEDRDVTRLPFSTQTGQAPVF